MLTSLPADPRSASTAARMSPTAAASSPIATGSPSMRSRSAYECRCGLVKSAVRSPPARRMPSIIAATLPLPFVPVTWTVPRPRCGSPSRRSSERMEARFMGGLAEAPGSRSMSTNDSRNAIASCSFMRAIVGRCAMLALP